MASKPAASSGRSSRVVELLNSRRASRAIETRKIPDEAVRDMIEAARLAPSCFNNQPWRFLFLEGHDALVKGREALSEGNRLWASRAPLLIVAYSRRQDDCLPKDGRQYHEFDLGLACMNLMLAATERGLTCRPMAGFDPAAIRESFHDLRLVGGEERFKIVFDISTAPGTSAAGLETCRRRIASRVAHEFPEAEVIIDIEPSYLHDAPAADRPM